MLFYDFEVFQYDWLVVVMDSATHAEHVIINSYDQLKALYDAHIDDVWIGYNSRHYDQYILKAILALGKESNGLDVSISVANAMNTHIIRERKEGWSFSNQLRRIPLNNYDVMPNPPIGLKTLEGFMGSDIKESEVSFDVERKLTAEEIEETVKYCRHDVEQTIKVFIQKKADFEAQFEIVKAFGLSLNHIGDTEARITANVLGCVHGERKDEFDYTYLPCLQLVKYRCVMDWFESIRQEALSMDFARPEDTRKWCKSQNLTMDIAGVPHSFGFGGLHGAPERPLHAQGLILHVDVNNYYPSMLIAWDLVTRGATTDNYQKVYQTRKALKHKQIEAAKSGNKAEAKRYKKAQLPYKKMLNSLSGAMKDIHNPAYDPRNNNIMCINGQLMLLDLIEHLEVVPGFELIQSNTDGLIIRIPNTDDAFNQVDDICYEWEQRCSTEKCEILLELDTIKEIYQKDVNNYLWVDVDGGIECKGKYVKELSTLDNDLPILNKALVEYMVHKTPVERTIRECDDLIMFQKIVKLSDKYRWVRHEGKHDKVYTYKSYRVFASNDPTDGRILKCKDTNSVYYDPDGIEPIVTGYTAKGDKFADTPNHCFICNDDITDMKCPPKLDKQWYIDFAKRRLKHFGIM